MGQVAGISTARKIGLVARVATRVAARQAGRSRRVSALTRAGRVTFSHFSRVLRLLWLQVTGFFFLALALLGGGALVDEYPKYQAGKVSGARLVLAALFMLLFFYFGVSSFWRVRNKS
ncbi:MAG TPA: hypothetical protein VKR26_13455 [Terriglobales bacterium]|nr:hypothetical protein [Terriglobales bacterium]